MFYYLGRKKRLAGSYPEPVHDTIIEPFAGSAAYSLHGERWRRDVIINDINPDTMAVWRYLQTASRKDIELLPELQVGEKLSDYPELSYEERWLISYHINPGANQRSNVVTAFSRWSAGKRYIAANIHKIKHWVLMESDYKAVPDLQATWFIDPPYHATKQYYMASTVDYTELAAWTMARTGQVIACEQQGATWLPFQPFTSIAICGNSRSKEAVWFSPLGNE
jgi:hypothetical protein